jgi:hypothetical protein
MVLRDWVMGHLPYMGVLSCARPEVTQLDQPDLPGVRKKTTTLTSRVVHLCLRAPFFHCRILLRRRLKPTAAFNFTRPYGVGQYDCSDITQGARQNSWMTVDSRRSTPTCCASSARHGHFLFFSQPTNLCITAHLCRICYEPIWDGPYTWPSAEA